MTTFDPSLTKHGLSISKSNTVGLQVKQVDSGWIQDDLMAFSIENREKLHVYVAWKFFCKNVRFWNMSRL